MIALKARECMEVAPSFIAERVCNGMYSPKELVDNELEILRTLGWRLNGPTPFDFIHYFLELLPTSFDRQIVKVLANDAIKLSEAAVTEYSVALEPFSIIAYESIKACISADDSKEKYR